MSRQKFLPTHKDKQWALGPGAADLRPKLIQIVGECIAIWPYIENDLALFLAGLLRANTRPALAVFFTLRTGRVQREAILAAANATLEAGDLELLSAALLVIASAETARNDLAHGAWGSSTDLEDCLLWVEGKDLGPWNAEAVLSDEIPDRPRHMALLEKTFVYREKDLLAVKQQLTDARTVSFNLALLGLRQNPHAIDGIRHQLRTLAPIQRALLQAAEAKQKREAPK